MARTKVSAVPQPDQDDFRETLKAWQVPMTDSVASIRRYLPLVLATFVEGYCDQLEAHLPENQKSASVQFITASTAQLERTAAKGKGRAHNQDETRDPERDVGQNHKSPEDSAAVAKPVRKHRRTRPLDTQPPVAKAPAPATATAYLAGRSSRRIKVGTASTSTGVSSRFIQIAGAEGVGRVEAVEEGAVDDVAESQEEEEGAEEDPEGQQSRGGEVTNRKDGADPTKEGAERPHEQEYSRPSVSPLLPTLESNATLPITSSQSYLPLTYSNLSSYSRPPSVTYQPSETSHPTSNTTTSSNDEGNDEDEDSQVENYILIRKPQISTPPLTAIEKRLPMPRSTVVEPINPRHYVVRSESAPPSTISCDRRIKKAILPAPSEPSFIPFSSTSRSPTVPTSPFILPFHSPNTVSNSSSSGSEIKVFLRLNAGGDGNDESVRGTPTPPTSDDGSREGTRREDDEIPRFQLDYTKREPHPLTNSRTTTTVFLPLHSTPFHHSSRRLTPRTPPHQPSRPFSSNKITKWLFPSAYRPYQPVHLSLHYHHPLLLLALPLQPPAPRRNHK
ncbi:hypothetical protein P7C70_g5749, partial [Phenoliferia sp. Uapishka_3]